jgi:hypothetical protein
MPDAGSIPFRQASGNGHYESKQLPDDRADFQAARGLLPGGGSVVGPGVSVDSEMALYSGSGGITLKRATGTGYVSVVNGVYQSPVAVDAIGRMPRGHIWGLTLSNNATDAVNDIDIAVGEARDSTNVADMVGERDYRGWMPRGPWEIMPVG